jgi:hypothetical protein
VNSFEVITELLSVKVMKNTTSEDLPEKLLATLERHHLSWNKLISVTTDRSPNLKRENLALLKMIQDINGLRGTFLNHKILFSLCIIHQKILSFFFNYKPHDKLDLLDLTPLVPDGT